MLLRKGNGWGFYLLWIFAITVSVAVACDKQRSDHDCPHRNISVGEGESVEVPLPASEIVGDVCIWNNATGWESACHFSPKDPKNDCQHFLNYFKEKISTKGNKFKLNHASHNASGLYMLLNNSGNCMVSMQISVLSARPNTTSSPKSGAFNIRFTKWSGVTGLCFLATIPILTMFSYL